jgi:hypothetical protein
MITLYVNDILAGNLVKLRKLSFCPKGSSLAVGSRGAFQAFPVRPQQNPLPPFQAIPVKTDFLHFTPF